MSLDIVYTILAIIALLFALAFISAADMAFAALNRARVKHLAESGKKRAALVLRLLERFDELISALVVTSNALYVAAATVSSILFLQLLGEVGPFVSGIVIIVVAVVFTDDLPVSIAKQAPEKFAMITAPIVLVLMKILKPVTFLLVKWKLRINKRLFSKKNDDEIGFRGEELLYVVEEAEQEGAITEEDMLRISNAIEFNDLLTEDILTPRVNIVRISKNSGIDEVMNVFSESGYSRLPVYEDTIDNIVGIVYIKDFLKCLANKADTIDDIISPALYTALVTPLPKLFKLLQKEKKHMAIVVDEHGGTEGLVTMDDILMELVGDIWDESDEYVEEFTTLGNNKHKVICTADIYKMFEYFDLDMKNEPHSLTVGGWIIDELERIPKKGDKFTYENLTVTVTKANHKRAKECIVEVVADDTAE